MCRRVWSRSGSASPTRSSRQRRHCLALLLFLAVCVVPAQRGHAVDPPADPSLAGSERNGAAREWFQDAKLGLFVHWGVYALVGKGEWVMEKDKLPISQYAKLPPRFKPEKFDALAWVKLAKSAGARYITITAKHHDGFCMFASKLTDYDVVDATPYKADPLKALADACREQKIKLFFYYSLLDWHHPDYYPLGKTGRSSGRAPGGQWKQYVAYYQGQVRELCTNYGEIGGLWFDGWWDRPDAQWDLAGTYRMIHELQPGALVGNNHHVAPFPGEDFQMFEQDLPGANAAGFNTAPVARALPLETCLTINSSWGYDARDTKYKSAEQLIRALVGAAGRGANLLMNVGPRPDGTIGSEFTERLLGVGKWLDTYGDSIYGTHKGPISPQLWGVSTAKGPVDHPREIYLHVLDFKDEAPITFHPSLAWTPTLFGKKTPLTLTRHEGDLRLEIPQEVRQPVDTIIVMVPTSSGRQ
jgi:alpha-L-fucosidase